MDSLLSANTATSIQIFRDRVGALAAGTRVAESTSADCVVGIQPAIVVEPADQEELAQALKLADEMNLGVVPRGAGTKLGWGNAPTRADVVLSTKRLDRVIEHAWADLTVTVEAGCTIEKLQSTLAKHGQRLAMDALWPERATVGGVLATNDSGVLRLRFGALRDLIIGVTLVPPDGTIAHSGGKVVKNVAGYDLPKLVTGSLGTLGVIARAVFRLHPLPKYSRTLTIAAANLDQAQRILRAVEDSKLAHSALQVRVAADESPEVDVLFEGTEAGLGAQCNVTSKLVEPAAAKEADASCWSAREQLWPSAQGATGDLCREECAVIKISVLPASIGEAIEDVNRVANVAEVRWRAVVQATGIGWLRLEGEAAALFSVLRSLRESFEKRGGSLVLLHRPVGMQPFETWGMAGDALPLMRAVKKRLDPKSTLTPGRFVGGI
jgi:glycolate oxidase FAD binding subunit